MIENIKTFYKCPYCSRKWGTYDEAHECAVDCVDVDEPIEDEEVTYQCEYCSKVSDNYYLIHDCEQDHIENKDELWEKVRLLKASQNPNQTKLIK